MKLDVHNYRLLENYRVYWNKPICVCWIYKYKSTIEDMEHWKE